MDLSADNELWGEFEQSIDDKGRLVLPIDLRKPLGEEFVITRGPDRAVWLLPFAEWERIYQLIRPGAANGRLAAVLQRQHGGRAFVKYDSQFRLTIPKHFRDYAEINENQKAVLVGVGDRVELWQKTIWDAYNQATFNLDLMHQATESLRKLQGQDAAGEA